MQRPYQPDSRRLHTVLNQLSLQERFDDLRSEKEKNIYTLNRDVTRLRSEISRLKKVHEHEKSRRIELEQRERILSSKISERQISHQHEVASLKQDYDSKLDI